MPETTPLIKAALNLRVGAGFDVYEITIPAPVPLLHAATGAGYFLHKKITGSNVFTFDPVLMIYLMFSDVPIQYPVLS